MKLPCNVSHLSTSTSLILNTLVTLLSGFFSAMRFLLHCSYRWHFLFVRKFWKGIIYTFSYHVFSLYMNGLSRGYSFKKMMVVNVCDFLLSFSPYKQYFIFDTVPLLSWRSCNMYTVLSLTGNSNNDITEEFTTIEYDDNVLIQWTDFKEMVGFKIPNQTQRPKLNGRIPLNLNSLASM